MADGGRTGRPEPAGSPLVNPGLKEAWIAAGGLDDELMDEIRAELHASTECVPEPPVPLARSAQHDDVAEDTQTG